MILSATSSELVWVSNLSNWLNSVGRKLIMVATSMAWRLCGVKYQLLKTLTLCNSFINFYQKLFFSMHLIFQCSETCHLRHWVFRPPLKYGQTALGLSIIKQDNRFHFMYKLHQWRILNFLDKREGRVQPPPRRKWGGRGCQLIIWAQSFASYFVTLK